jgi:hypothetical protein
MIQPSFRIALYSGFDLKQLHRFKSAGAARIRAMRGNPL